MLRFDMLTDREAEVYRQAYLAGLPHLVERLQQRLARTGGPTADGSVAALAPLGAWLVEQLDRDEPDGLEGTPRWWVDTPGSPAADDEPGELLTDSQLRLVDEVGAYFATVLTSAIPEATWIVFHDKRHKNNDAENKTMLRLPNKDVVNPATFVYRVAIRRCLYQREPEPNVLYEFAQSCGAAT
jgi:hypothetical protein